MIADLATVREAVTIGEQTIVGRGVAIENRCTIGKRCKLETDAYITAYSELEDDVFVAPMVATSNDNYMARGSERFKHFKGVTVRRGGRIGVNATVLPARSSRKKVLSPPGLSSRTTFLHGSLLPAIQHEHFATYLKSNCWTSKRKGSDEYEQADNPDGRSGR